MRDLTDLLKERERGEETDYFRRADAKLIEKMRARAQLSEIAQALADKLRVDDPELLRRVAELGLDRETGTAILVAPLVQVAWADGHVSEAERSMVLELAASRGLVAGMPAHDKLLEWLRERPSDAVFETALEVMRVGFSVLPAAERDERITSLVAACRRIAEASGGGLVRLIGLSHGVFGAESATLDAITTGLTAEH
jgi:prepilin-type processing-associated H-X9-DG protein